MNVKFNKNRGKENFDWSILIIISLASLVTGIYRDGFAALFPFLQRDFALTRAQLGLHSTFIFFTSAIVAILAGRVVDFKGSKWGLIFGSLFTGIFIILHSLAPDFFVLLIIAALTGLAMSINLPAVSKGIIEWFPKGWRGTALGIQSTAFPIGGMLGSMLLPFLGSMLGWRKTIIFPGLLTILYAFFVLNFYQNKERIQNDLKEDEKNRFFLGKNINQLTRNSNLIRVSVLGFFLGAINGAIVAHFTLFLYLDYGLAESLAGLGFAVVQLGSILGRPGWGIICDRLLQSNKSKTFLYIGFLFTFLTLIFGLVLVKFNPPVGVLFLLAFLTGWSGRGWQGLFLASAAETVKEEHVGIAIGFALFFMRLGMTIAPPVFGYIADLRGSYSFSWLLLGLIMLITSVGQYLFYIKTKDRNRGHV